LASNTLTTYSYAPLAPLHGEAPSTLPYKNVGLLAAPHLRLYSASRPYAELAPAVLDSEWVSTWPHAAVVTPTPYEDVDPLFVHRRWAPEINTTRRTDHSARFRVTWGPFAATRARSEHLATAPLTSTGPSVPASVAPRVALSTAGLVTAFAHPHTHTPATQARLHTLTHVSSPHQGYLPDTAPVPTQSASASVRSLLAAPQFTPHVLALAQAHLWSFRPPVYPANRFYAGSTNSPAPLVFACLTSRLTAPQSRVSWAPGTSHPLMAQLGLLRPTPTLATFLSQLSAGAATSPRASFDLYTAMPEDVRTIRRLRSSKAVCLPCDLPLHIICGSKDVIHSWAIPGLGLKIDCIPGFSSHRRLLLRWRGVFWGQCMEVCGRYHHWMPILVHVTHRDLFVGWCLAFLKTLEGRTLTPTQLVAPTPQLVAWLAAAEVAHTPARALAAFKWHSPASGPPPLQPPRWGSACHTPFPLLASSLVTPTAPWWVGLPGSFAPYPFPGGRACSMVGPTRSPKPPPFAFTWRRGGVLTQSFPFLFLRGVATNPSSSSQAPLQPPLRVLASQHALPPWLSSWLASSFVATLCPLPPHHATCGFVGR